MTELETGLSDISLSQREVDPIARNVNKFKQLLHEKFPGCVVFICNNPQDYYKLYKKYNDFMIEDDPFGLNCIDILNDKKFISYVDELSENIDAFYLDKVVKFTIGPTFTHLSDPYSIHLLVDK